MLVSFHGISAGKTDISFSGRQDNDNTVVHRTSLTTEDYLAYPKDSTIGNNLSYLRCPE